MKQILNSIQIQINRGAKIESKSFKHAIKAHLLLNSFVFHTTKQTALSLSLSRHYHHKSYSLSDRGCFLPVRLFSIFPTHISYTLPPHTDEEKGLISSHEMQKIGTSIKNASSVVFAIRQQKQKQDNNNNNNAKNNIQ
jgi:hypothetical protein